LPIPKFKQNGWQVGGCFNRYISGKNGQNDQKIDFLDDFCQKRVKIPADIFTKIGIFRFFIFDISEKNGISGIYILSTLHHEKT